MEGKEVFKKSYNYLNDLLGDNCSCKDKLIINFTMMDTESAGRLRKAITEVINISQEKFNSLHKVSQSILKNLSSSSVSIPYKDITDEEFSNELRNKITETININKRIVWEVISGVQ